MEHFNHQLQPHQDFRQGAPPATHFQNQYSTTANSNIRLPPISNSLPGPQTAFQTFDDFEFYRLGTTSYRLSVSTIEGTPYVAISHWWFNQAQASWFPSRKQIFLPKAAWFNLLSHSDRPSTVIRTFPEPIDCASGSFCDHCFSFIF